jgi:hypothetical protein
VTFDPTPSAGRAATTRSGLAGVLSKYSEALELMWFQYVVGYDKDEQHSLVTTLRKQFVDFLRGSVSTLAQGRAALPALIKPVLLALGSFAGLMAVMFFTRRVRHFGWRGFKVWQGDAARPTRVDFYERLLKALEKQGINRELYQTPLEFASAVGVNEAQSITNAYNRVRFGAEKLTEVERSKIEVLLARIERS